MKKTNMKGGNAGKVVALGAGIAALGAATYFLLGPSGKKNQKKIKSWMVKMKGDIGERLENLQEVSEPMYRKIIDSAAAAYSTAQTVDKSELASYVRNLKNDWKNISRAATKTKMRKPGKKKASGAMRKKSGKKGRK